MSFNSDILVTELSKWTNMMLIEFILNKSLPSNCKVSDDLQSTLQITSINLVSDMGDSANVALIFKSVVSELKVIFSSSNLKMHDMMNSLSTRSSEAASSSFVPPACVMASNSISDFEPVRQHLVNKIAITAAAPYKSCM